MGEGLPHKDKHSPQDSSQCGWTDRWTDRGSRRRRPGPEPHSQTPARAVRRRSGLGAESPIDGGRHVGQGSVTPPVLGTEPAPDGGQRTGRSGGLASRARPAGRRGRDGDGAGLHYLPRRGGAGSRRCSRPAAAGGRRSPRAPGARRPRSSRTAGPGEGRGRRGPRPAPSPHPTGTRPRRHRGLAAGGRGLPARGRGVDTGGGGGGFGRQNQAHKWHLGHRAAGWQVSEGPRGWGWKLGGLTGGGWGGSARTSRPRSLHTKVRGGQGTGAKELRAQRQAEAVAMAT